MIGKVHQRWDCEDEIDPVGAAEDGSFLSVHQCMVTERKGEVNVAVHRDGENTGQINSC